MHQLRALQLTSRSPACSSSRAAVAFGWCCGTTSSSTSSTSIRGAAGVCSTTTMHPRHVVTMGPAPAIAAASAAAAGPMPTSSKPTPPSTAGTGAVFPELIEEQLQDKLARVQELFAGQTLPDIEVHRSHPAHFRMRAEFRVWHEGADLMYVMFEQPGEQQGGPGGDGSEPASEKEERAAADGDQADDPQAAAAAAAGSDGGEAPSPTKQPAQRRRGSRRGSVHGHAASVAAGGGSGSKRVARVRINEFPVASAAICALMPLLRAELMRGTPVLREKLFQVNFHTSLSGQAMVTMTYHKQLDDVWEAAARDMRGRLLKAVQQQQGGEEQAGGQAPVSVLHIIGRSRKQKVLLDAEHVTEVMQVAGRSYEYMQVAGCFSQPNGGVCQQMVNWAVDVTKGSSGDLLELYCGAGTFTLPLAANFNQVVATEIAKASVAAARHNIQANGLSDKIFLARMSSEEFVETWRIKGTRQRLAGLRPWDALSLHTLLVDPPRAGLDPESEALLRDFDQVVYISCNPETLAKNLAAVADTHRIERFAVFDQFPYTSHLECGVLLRRNVPTQQETGAA